METTEVVCRKCKREFIPSFRFDFYQDDKDGPGTGLCERCMMNEVFNADPVDIPSEEHRDKVCKMGKGRETCVFLIVHPERGIQCALGSGLNNTIVSKAKSGEIKSRCINCEGKHGNFKIKNPPFDYDLIKK